VVWGRLLWPDVALCVAFCAENAVWGRLLWPDFALNFSI
jgi:hypothetical protein